MYCVKLKKLELIFQRPDPDNSKVSLAESQTGVEYGNHIHEVSMRNRALTNDWTQSCYGLCRAEEKTNHDLTKQI